MNRRTRRGVSLVEMLIALTISAGLGAATIALLSNSMRFEERTEAQRAARLVGRSAVNVLVNDLRLIDPSWGIDSASAHSLRVKAPYALGVVCDTALKMTIALVPVDSAVLAVPGYSGFAWRAINGTYTVVPGGTLTTSSVFPAACTAAGVQPITAPATAPNQKTVIAFISGTPRAGIRLGSVVMLYRRITFSFAESGLPALAGRTALWRNYIDSGRGATELVAPLDARAAFGFYVSGSSTVQAKAPGPLSTLRGLQLNLPGESERTPRQRSAPEQASLTTSVFFLNTGS